MHPDEQRAAAREAWAGAAAGWERHRAAQQRMGQPVSVWMIDRLGLQPGHRVLELAAGAGDTGLLAAELVAPGGRVIVTDAAEPMVEAARRRADALELRNVETRVMEAEWIDLPAASMDGVLVRWGLMLLVDPAASLRECRRVLRSGGRLAAATWAPAEQNPWASAVTAALVDAGHAPAPDRDAPGMFALSDPETLGAMLEDAGFEDVEVEALDLVSEHADAEAYWRQRVDMSPTLGDRLKALSPAEHHRLRDDVDARLAPYLQADGTLRIPGRALVAAGEA